MYIMNKLNTWGVATIWDWIESLRMYIGMYYCLLFLFVYLRVDLHLQQLHLCHTLQEINKSFI